MRARPQLVITVLAAMVATISPARACEPIVTECLPATVVYPAYAADGTRIGSVEAPVRHLPPLEPSRFTGQPLTVVFNNPGSRPGAVHPYGTLMRLPRVRRSETQAVYPRGY